MWRYLVWLIVEYHQATVPHDLYHPRHQNPDNFQQGANRQHNPPTKLHEPRHHRPQEAIEAQGHQWLEKWVWQDLAKSAAELAKYVVEQAVGGA